MKRALLLLSCLCIAVLSFAQRGDSRRSEKTWRNHDVRIIIKRVHGEPIFITRKARHYAKEPDIRVNIDLRDYTRESYRWRRQAHRVRNEMRDGIRSVGHGVRNVIRIRL
jgi:hypothetical protein